MLPGLTRGQPVLDAGGERLGEVRITGLVEENTRIHYFVVRKHRFLGGEFAVPEDAVHDVLDGVVRLRLDHDAAHAMPAFTGRAVTAPDMKAAHDRLEGTPP